VPFYKDGRIMPQFVFVRHIFSDGQKKAAIPFSTAKAALVIKN